MPYGSADELAMLRQALATLPTLGLLVLDLQSQRFILAAGGLARGLGYYDMVDHRWREVVPVARHGSVMSLIDDARRSRGAGCTTHWVSVARPGLVLRVTAYATPPEDPRHVVIVAVDREAAAAELGWRTIGAHDADDVSGFGE